MLGFSLMKMLTVQQIKEFTIYCWKLREDHKVETDSERLSLYLQEIPESLSQCSFS